MSIAAWQRIAVGLGLLVPGFMAGGGCSSNSPSSDQTAASSGDAGGDAVAPPYQGTTTGGVAPNPPDPGTGTVYADGGTFTVDSTCCPFTFSIPNDQPASTTGVVKGNEGPLAVAGGVPLTLANGVWSGTACIPINATVLYWYEFTPPAVSQAGGDGGPLGDAASDGGTADSAPGDSVGDDGGSAEGGNDAAPPPVTVHEHNPTAPTTPDGDGNVDNVYGPLTSCTGADGG